MVRKRPSACDIKAELMRPGSGGSGAGSAVDFSLDPHALADASDDMNLVTAVAQAARAAGVRLPGPSFG